MGGSDRIATGLVGTTASSSAETDLGFFGFIVVASQSMKARGLRRRRVVVVTDGNDGTAAGLTGQAATVIVIVRLLAPVFIFGDDIIVVLKIAVDALSIDN